MSLRGPSSPSSDAALVASAQRGDSSAFDALVGRYQDRVFNLCYRMCGNEADALDLTQTTFLRAFQALPTFRTQSAFYTWIFRIATNAVISHLRKKTRAQVRSLDAPAGNDGSPAFEPQADPQTHDPHRHLERAEAVRQISAALAGLPPEFRAAVILKDIEQMDYATIAEVLGIPIGTVRSRIARGRMMLRQALTAAKGPVDHAAT